MSRFISVLMTHSVVLLYFLTVCCMLLFQWRVQYIWFPYQFILLVSAFALMLYVFALLFNLFVTMKHASLKELIYFSLIWASFVIMLFCIIAESSIDIPLSPHALIDPYLVRVDQFFGFNVANIMEYFRIELPKTNAFFIYVYNSLLSAVILTVCILPLLHWQRFEKILLMFFILTIMTLIFCYFFPSIGPVYSYPDTKFYKQITHNLHDYLQLRQLQTTLPANSDIACPSWHTISALLISIGWWKVKRFGVRYIGVIYCILVIISILTTGEHYLTDALAAIIFVGIAFILANKMLKKPDDQIALINHVIYAIKLFINKIKN